MQTDFNKRVKLLRLLKKLQIKQNHIIEAKRPIPERDGLQRWKLQ